MWIRKLTRTGDSWQVTIPVTVARQWLDRHIVAVGIEYNNGTLQLEPLTRDELLFHRPPAPLAGPADANR